MWIDKSHGSFKKKKKLLSFSTESNFLLLQGHTLVSILTLEQVFGEILKRGDMYVERTISLTISGEY